MPENEYLAIIRHSLWRSKFIDNMRKVDSTSHNTFHIVYVVLIMTQVNTYQQCTLLRRRDILFNCGLEVITVTPHMLQVDLPFMGIRQYQRPLRALKLLTLGHIYQPMRDMLSNGKSILDRLLAFVQFQYIGIIVKDLIFSVFSDLSFTFKQVIPNLDYVVVIIKMSVDEAVKHTGKSAYQFGIWDFVVVK